MTEQAKQEAKPFQLTIAVANTRKATKWKNLLISWEDFTDRLKNPLRTAETVAEYRSMPKVKQSEAKDVGGYVGGALKNGRRKSGCVANRSLITLDIDNWKSTAEAFWKAVTETLPYTAVCTSTHSHTRESPRLRLILPLQSPVFPDQYQAIGRKIAEKIEFSAFDSTTYEAERLMYWPSCPQDGDYFLRFTEGDRPMLDGEEFLKTEYDDWTDSSRWPGVGFQDPRLKHALSRQQNPLEKPGIVGAFCRTYDIDQAIETFLSDVYEPLDGAFDGRYSYRKGSAVGGLVVYDNRLFAYSHHESDPASSQLLNAFDLVRVHRYGDLDQEQAADTPVNRLNSYHAMIEFAEADEGVRRQLEADRAKEIEALFEDDLEEVDEAGKTEATEGHAEAFEWAKKLKYDKKGRLEETMENMIVILENDPRLSGKLYYDEFAKRQKVRGSLPWGRTNGISQWVDEDTASLTVYMEKTYGLYHQQKLKNALSTVFMSHIVHPVRDYLNGLVWDGLPRAETLFIDFLGAEDEENYTREVTRMQLIGAVKRIFEPGSKYDHMLILSGAQGIGKSTLLSRLGGEWFSDSLVIANGKEAFELLQGKWILEVAELTAMKKADLETWKQFISKPVDSFRGAYQTVAKDHPRQCVFFGTTNDYEFLRDKTGNRRFWGIACDGDRAELDVFKDFDTDYRDQVWAEAVERYKAGELPYPTDTKVSEAILERQKRFEEEDPQMVDIRAYLEMEVPADWFDKTMEERRVWTKAFLDGDDLEVGDGAFVRDTIRAKDVWNDVFGKAPADFNRAQAAVINRMLQQLPGWKRAATVRITEFGKEYQGRGFKKKTNTNE